MSTQKIQTIFSKAEQSPSSPTTYISKYSRLLCFGYIRQNALICSIHIPTELVQVILCHWYLSLSHITDHSERDKIFRHKLQTIDIDPRNSMRNKNNFLKADLQELVEYTSLVHYNQFPEQIIQCAIQMINKNVFRNLPPKTYSDYDPIEDDWISDPKCDHLHLIYEFLYNFIKLSEESKLGPSVNENFIVNLVSLFNSEDCNERECLKHILHQLYARIYEHRTCMRQSMKNVFYSIIYGNAHHNGIFELLEIYIAIINGLTMPIKEEHIRFLTKVVIPMHKVSFLPQFHSPLAYCVTEFIKKDSSFAVSIIYGLLRYWPNICCEKEVLFLNELEEILELMESRLFGEICIPVFQRIAVSICSDHFQVAESALTLCNNDIIFSLIYDYKERIMPIVYPSVVHSCKHWNWSVSSYAAAVMSTWKEMGMERNGYIIMQRANFEGI